MTAATAQKDRKISHFVKWTGPLLSVQQSILAPGSPEPNDPNPETKAGIRCSLLTGPRHTCAHKTLVG